MFRGYFGNFFVSGVFWSFYVFFWGGGILVICRFQGYFGHFLDSWGIWYFLSFRGILVFFGFWVVFLSFLGFEGILVNFFVSGVFWSFFRFHGYSGNFLGLGGILVIL